MVMFPMATTLLCRWLTRGFDGSCLLDVVKLPWLAWDVGGDAEQTRLCDNSD